MARRVPRPQLPATAPSRRESVKVSGRARHPSPEPGPCDEGADSMVFRPRSDRFQAAYDTDSPVSAKIVAMLRVSTVGTEIPLAVIRPPSPFT